MLDWDWFCPHCERGFSQEELNKFKEEKIKRETKEDLETRLWEEFLKNPSEQITQVLKKQGIAFTAFITSILVFVGGLLLSMFGVIFSDKVANYFGAHSTTVSVIFITSGTLTLIVIIVSILSIAKYSCFIDKQFSKFEKLKSIPNGN